METSFKWKFVHTMHCLDPGSKNCHHDPSSNSVQLTKVHFGSSIGYSSRPALSVHFKFSCFIQRQIFHQTIVQRSVPLIQAVNHWVVWLFFHLLSLIMNLFGTWFIFVHSATWLKSLSYESIYPQWSSHWELWSGHWHLTLDEMQDSHEPLSPELYESTGSCDS